MRAKLLFFGFVIWGFGRRAFLGPNYRLRLARRGMLGCAVGARLRAKLLFFGFVIWGFGRRASLGPNYRLRLARRGMLGCAVGARLRAKLLFFGFTIWGFGRRAFLGPNYRLRLARRVTFANRGKSNQNRLPLHPAPASPGSPRSGAVPGARHEGPSMALAALAASLPLNPLHDTCARPAEGANWCGLRVWVGKARERSRKAEKQKSRKAEKQKSRKAEKQSCCGRERETTVHVGCIRKAMHRFRIGGVPGGLFASLLNPPLHLMQADAAITQTSATVGWKTATRFPPLARR